MARTPSCDKSGMRKGTWTAEEDKKLIAYVTRYGCWNWRQLPKFAGLARCGKSCRLRWMNYLRPNLKRGNFTPQEEDLIIRMHRNLGNRWSIIAAELPGRTDNEVKNHWHTTLKKRVQENTMTNEETLPSIESNTPVSKNGSVDDSKFTLPTGYQISDITGPLSPLSSTSEFSSITSDYSTAVIDEKLMLEDNFGFLDDLTQHINESFWIDQSYSYTPSGTGNNFINNTDCANFQNEDVAATTTPKMKNDTASIAVSSYHSSNESTSFGVDNDLGSFLDAYNHEPTIESSWTHPYAADMSHVSTESLIPFVGESDYFTTLYDVDLWSSL